MIAFTQDYRESTTSMKHGNKWCSRCRFKTKQERYERINKHGVISRIYRCTECNKLMTEYKK